MLNNIFRNTYPEKERKVEKIKHKLQMVFMRRDTSKVEGRKT